MVKKSLCAFLCLTFLFFCGCVGEAGAKPTPVAWEPSRQTPEAPQVSVAPEVSGYDNNFTEIDIDLDDEYRDFILETMLTDHDASTRFYRLVGGDYVELGVLYGLVTNDLSNIRPRIELDGKGYLYMQARSELVSFEYVAKMYTVSDLRLVETPPQKSAYYPFERRNFEVLRRFDFLQTDLTVDALNALDPAQYGQNGWESLLGERKKRSKWPGDELVIIGSDENKHLILDEGGYVALLEMKELDVFADGKYLPEYLYNEQIDNYYRAG